MAKQPVEQENPFRKTSGTQNEPIDTGDLGGLVSPVGIGLTSGERAALDGLAAQYGITRHFLLKLAVRLFILNVRAGKVNISDYVEVPETPKNKGRLPGE